MEKAIGLFGGTFNPVHLGHLQLAEAAKVQFHLDEIIIFPNSISPCRNAASEEIIPAEERYQMCRLAVNGHPDFQVSRIELDREGNSYTYDTVLAFKRKHPEHRYFFITGADSLLLYTWRRFSDLLELLDGLLIADRAEKAEQAVEKLKKEFPAFSAKLHRVRMDPLPISATEIRQRLRAGKSIRDLVPEPVADYIAKQHFYEEIP